MTNTSVFEAQNFETQHGAIKKREWNLNGVRLAHAQTVYAKKGVFRWQDDRDIVHLHFTLNGNCRFEASRLSQVDELTKGDHNLLYAPFGDMIVHNHDYNIETFGIQFEVNRFVKLADGASDSVKRFAANLLEGKARMLTPQWGKLDNALLQAIQAVIENPFSGELQRQWIWFKAIEILVLQAESLGAEAPLPSLVFTGREQSQLNDAREMLRSRLNEPPTLPEIASAIGLNEYKLKRGFKARFGTTIFRYLTQMRLEKARQLLLDSNISSKAIADELGYSSPQHLSTAFRRQFGKSPRDYRNSHL